MRSLNYAIAALGIAGLVLVFTMPMAYSHIVGAVRSHSIQANSVTHDGAGTTLHDICFFGNVANPQQGNLHYVDSNGNQQHDHPNEPTICKP